MIRSALQCHDSLISAMPSARNVRAQTQIVTTRSCQAAFFISRVLEIVMNSSSETYLGSEKVVNEAEEKHATLR